MLGELGASLRDPSLLTPSKICHLHALIMEHCRFAEVEEDGLKFKYLIRAGKYRVLSSGTTLEESDEDLVASAPPHHISAEMDRFCQLAQVLIRSILSGANINHNSP
jgi:hypothetical protein